MDGAKEEKNPTTITYLMLTCFDFEFDVPKLKVVHERL